MPTRFCCNNFAVTFYICSTNRPALQNNLVRVVFFIGLSIGITSCNRQLTSVLIEDPNGNVELIYAGAQSAENLVKEIRYYPSGDTMTVTPMKKGAVEGVVRSFHKDNRPKDEVTFVKGKQDGLFRKFDKEGQLVFEGHMKNGLKDGVWTTWYDETQMQEQRTYVSDQPHGTWTYWYIDGNVKREETYDLGKLLGATDFDQ